MTQQATLTATKRRGFYFWMAVLMLVIVLMGFGSSLGTGSYNQAEPFPLLLIIHGIILLAWFLWLVLQTTLVRTGRTPLHRRMGKFGAAIGAAVILSTPFVTLSNPARLRMLGLEWDSDMAEAPWFGIEGMRLQEFVTTLLAGNFFTIISFAILLTAAVISRGRPEIHKRLILLASIPMMPPALARISRWPYLGGEDGVFVPVAVVCLLAAVITHDVITLRRIHRATLAGISTFITVMTAMQFAVRSEAGQAFVRSLA